MQITYHQQYKDIDDRQIINLALSEKNVGLKINQETNMDVPLALYFIRIITGVKGYRRKSSTYNRKADVDGLSAFIKVTFHSMTL